MQISTVIRVTELTLGHLLEGAKYHADAALTAYTNGDTRSILMNAAVSMEQVSKALLFSMHPALLAETNNGQFDSLLHLTGFGEKAVKLTAPKTIGARGSLVRVRQVMVIKTPKEPLDQLIDVRDGVLHTGLLDERSTRELLAVCLRYSNELYDALGIPVKKRWDQWEELAESLTSQVLTDAAHEVRRKLAWAKRNQADFLFRLPEGFSEKVALAHRELAMEALSGPSSVSPAGHIMDGGSMVCPVCDDECALYLGHVRTDKPLIDPSSQTFDENLMVEVEGQLVLIGMACFSCMLTLVGQDEIRAAGVSPERPVSLPTLVSPKVIPLLISQGGYATEPD